MDNRVRDSARVQAYLTGRRAPGSSARSWTRESSETHNAVSARKATRLNVCRGADRGYHGARATYQRSIVRIIQVATGVLLSCVLAAAGAADVYRWVDHQGQVHFGDRPPQVEAATKLDLPSGPASEETPEVDRSQALERLLRYYDEKRADEREAGARARQEQAVREARCKEARRRLSTYEAAARIYTTGEDGQRHFLSGDERDQLIGKLQAAISRWCEG